MILEYFFLSMFKNNLIFVRYLFKLDNKTNKFKKTNKTYRCCNHMQTF